MKKKKLLLFTIVLLCIGTFYAYRFYNKSFLLDVDYENGLSFCYKKIEQKDKTILSSKYYYYNIWNTKCKPCIKEMPALDSIASTTTARIAYIYVSDDDDETVNSFLNKRNIHSKKFIFLNDMNYFISAIFKKVKNNYKAYPTHVVTDSIGNILYFSQGGVSTLNLENQNLSKEKKEELYSKMKDPLITFLQKLK